MSNDYYTDDLNVIELNKNDFSNDNKLTNPNFNNKFGILKVYADWCGHCKNMKDMIKFLGKELKQENFVIGALNYGTYDKDNKPDCLKDKIRSFPSLLMINYDGSIEPLPNNTSNDMDNILDNICIYTEKNATVSSKPKVCKKVSNKLENR